MSKYRLYCILLWTMVFSSLANSETQVVADGLAVYLPETLDITYQVIPYYDDTENVIAGWDGDEFQYFVAFSKLPPGWLDADAWIAGFARDMRAASERGAFEIQDRGSYKSSGGYDLTYIKISFVPKGDYEARSQLVHFISDNRNSYLAFASPVSEGGKSKLVEEVTTILKTAHLPASNVTLLIRRNEDRYFGVWIGEYTNGSNQRAEVVLELKSDLTFVRNEKVDGLKGSVYSGVWFISNNVLTFTYLYGTPTTQEVKSEESSEITAFDGDIMVLNSNPLEVELVMHRAE